MMEDNRPFNNLLPILPPPPCFHFLCFLFALFGLMFR